MDPEFENITHNGQTWRYLQLGSGDRNVILIHGFPDTPQSWLGIAQALASDYRVTVPYLRGYHPDTLVPGRSFQAAELGGDVIGLLDALDIDQTVLVGHDWGASCIYEAVRAHPERVAGLVPIAVPHPRALRPGLKDLFDARHFFYFKAPLAEPRTAFANFHYIDTLYDRWGGNWSGPEREAAVTRVKQAYSDPAVLKAAIDYYRDLDLRGSGSGGAKVQCPALLAAGSSDFVPEAHERSKKYFEGPVDLWMAEGAGHWPHREQQAEFVEQLKAFLATVPWE